MSLYLSWAERLDMLHHTMDNLAFYCRFHPMDPREDPLTIPMSSLDLMMLMGLFDDVRSLVEKSPDLDFLKEMPYDQFKHWVMKCFITYFQIQQDYKDPQNFADIIQIVRAYRKARNKAKKGGK